MPFNATINTLKCIFRRRTAPKFEMNLSKDQNVQLVTPQHRERSRKSSKKSKRDRSKSPKKKKKKDRERRRDLVLAGILFVPEYHGNLYGMTTYSMRAEAAGERFGQNRTGNLIHLNYLRNFTDCVRVFQ